MTITGILTPVSAHYTIPIQGHLACPDILPTDVVTHTATLLGTVVYGVPTLDPVTGTPVGGNLYLKVAYQVHIVVTREELVDVALCPTT
ncbi:MAG: hypothetical protein AB1426_11475 [Bacillota bacterium]